MESVTNVFVDGEVLRVMVRRPVEEGDRWSVTVRFRSGGHVYTVRGDGFSNMEAHIALAEALLELGRKLGVVDG